MIAVMTAVMIAVTTAVMIAVMIACCWAGLLGSTETGLGLMETGFPSTTKRKETAGRSHVSQ